MTMQPSIPSSSLAPGQVGVDSPLGRKMKTIHRIVTTWIVAALGIVSAAAEKVVRITVGEPISKEAQEVLAKLTKCGSELSVHVSQEGKSSFTSTTTYRSQTTDDFMQIVITDDQVRRLYWRQGPTSEADYWKTDFSEVAQISILIPSLRISGSEEQSKRKNAQQDVAPPSTVPSESDSDGGDNPQSESEERSR